MGLLDQVVVHTLPLVPKPIVRRLSKSYIAGADLNSAIKVVQNLNEMGFRTTVDLLGEFVETFDQVQENVTGYEDVLRAIVDHNLDANISVKPTSFGLLLDEKRANTVLKDLLQKAVEIENFMRLDMEDSDCTTPTINMYKDFQDSFGDRVGIVLQAYLKRTQQDIKEITSDGPAHFRLCKGIYVEDESIAIKDYQGIRENFLACLELMFQSKSFVGIATHDDYLVEGAEKLIQKYEVPKNLYEFQMLLGVREPLRDEIKARGHELRIYVPYGQKWYEYSVRRLKENPSLAGTMFKAVLFGK